MKITKQLQEWLVANKGVSADATDDEHQKAAAEAMVDGSLTTEQFIELTKDPDADKATGLEAKLDALLNAVVKTTERIDAIEAKSVEPKKEPETKDYSDAKVSKDAPKLDTKKVSDLAGESPEQKSGTQVDVIEAHTRYSTTKSAATYPMQTAKGAPHPMAGKPVFEGGSIGTRQIDHPSELELACCGAWVKMRISRDLGHRCPAKLRMTDHDTELLKYAIDKFKWCGVWDGSGSEEDGAIGLKGEYLKPQMKVALVDEVANMGGQEVVPIVWDNAVILTPLLHSELFPRVNVVNITRGSRVESAIFLNPTLTSHTEDGSDTIDLTTTSGFVAEFNTTIYPVAGGIEMGLDFLSDSPVDVASIVTQSFGQQLLKWLDDQIANGDGTTEPEGVFTSSGPATATVDGSDNKVGDFESLLFAVAKEYRMQNETNRIVFCSNETVYQRARGIAVGASDERRVFGMTHEDYMLLGHPYSINESFADNTEAFFGNLARYRMYRRAGMTISADTTGKTLVRTNLLLLTARARFGGQIETGSAFSKTTLLPA
jgi:HK97 family phage major capsid protein